MADDPYSVLGLSRSVSDDDIRKAFRRLAKEYHPDVNPGNKSAAEKFKKLSAAYDILGDVEKRRKFDRGEIDASGEQQRGYSRQYAGGNGPRGARPGGPDFGLGDIFSDIFGASRGGAGGPGGFARKGQDVRYTLDVEFLEAVAGEKKRVTMPDGGMLDIAVPAGVADGQVLRLRAKGAAGLGGGDAGDALVEIKVRPHPLFKRQGDDILFEVPITIDEAVLGAKIEVPTVSGRVQLTIPKGTSSGKVFRLKGKGVKPAGSVATGDQLVSVRIVLPDTIDDTLSYFLTEWRQKHQYDPGRKG